MCSPDLVFLVHEEYFLTSRTQYQNSIYYHLSEPNSHSDKKLVPLLFMRFYRDSFYQTTHQEHLTTISDDLKCARFFHSVWTMVMKSISSIKFSPKSMRNHTISCVPPIEEFYSVMRIEIFRNRLRFMFSLLNLDVFFSIIGISIFFSTALSIAGQNSRSSDASFVNVISWQCRSTF